VQSVQNEEKNMSYYSDDEVVAFGFKHVGKHVLLSKKASIYNAANIEIGDYTRIDDFCVISAGEGGISIGRNVHIAVFSSIQGGARIHLGDFSGLSSRVSLYSSNSDYLGEYLTSPTVPVEFTNVTHSPVKLDKFVIIGSGSIVLPGVVIQEGSVVGALSLVKASCDPWGIYVGTPARRVGNRSNGLLKHVKDYLTSQRPKVAF